MRMLVLLLEAEAVAEVPPPPFPPGSVFVGCLLAAFCSDDGRRLFSFISREGGVGGESVGRGHCSVLHCVARGVMTGSEAGCESDFVVG